MNELYNVKLTKEQIIFLSAILGNMSVEESLELLRTPHSASIFGVSDWYWDTFAARDFISDEFVDELYGSIHSVAKQFKPVME